MTTATLAPGIDTLRQGDLDQLSTLLQSQQARALDVVAPAQKLRATGGGFLIEGVEPVLGDDGVTDVNGIYVPTSVADDGIAAKLDIHPSYLRRCRQKKIDLYDSNVNGWLADDKRKFLLRLFRADSGGLGVLRAFLSDSYLLGLDNFDTLLAVLAGIGAAGQHQDNLIIDADLTERRMIVRVAVPGIAAYAPKLLENYRNPFTGKDVGRGWTPSQLAAAAAREGHNVSDAVIFAGIVITNSEVGHGRFAIYPRLIVGPCTNGLQLTAEAFTKTHLGAALGEGIQWSQDTVQKNLQLVTAQATDAVKTFLDIDFITKQVADMEEVAGVALTAAPEPVITKVVKKLGFTEAAKDAILASFIRGGQVTAGGVGQAVSAYAQEIGDGDLAWEMERSAVKAMGLAVQANKELLAV